MKVLFLAAYSNLAAASRIKVYQFLPFLKKRGVVCKVICFTPSFVHRLRLISVDKKVLLLVYYPLSHIVKLFKIFQAVLIAKNFDIVFIQEPIVPFGFAKILKLVNKNIIFQFTDAVFITDQKEKGLFERLRLRILSNTWKRTVKIAKCCLVENDYNKEAVLKYCSYIDMITGPIDTDRYFVREEKKEKDYIVIGWTGSFFTTKYLYEINDVLLEVSKKYNILLRLIGAKKDFKIKGVNCDMREWSYETELAWLSTFNIGIMPLIDDEWTRGKAGYKLLQYMSMGISPIASSVGFNKEIVKDGVNGFLVTTKEEWVKKLSSLIENEELRKKIGKEARFTIEKNYALNKAEKKLFEIFNNVLNKF